MLSTDEMAADCTSSVSGVQPSTSVALRIEMPRVVTRLDEGSARPVS